MVARARGPLCGKEPKLTLRQEAHLAALQTGSEYTPGELAQLFRAGRRARDREPEVGYGETADDSGRTVARAVELGAVSNWHLG